MIVYKINMGQIDEQWAVVVADGVKKHQPKLAALGVHLHNLLSSSKHSGHRCDSLAASEREKNPALIYLSCRSMDPADVVCKYKYRPREVDFRCKSTSMHKRGRENNRHLRMQSHAAAD